MCSFPGLRPFFAFGNLAHPVTRFSHSVDEVGSHDFLNSLRGEGEGVGGIPPSGVYSEILLEERAIFFPGGRT